MSSGFLSGTCRRQIKSGLPRRQEGSTAWPCTASGVRRVVAVPKAALHQAARYRTNERRSDRLLRSPPPPRRTPPSQTDRLAALMQTEHPLRPSNERKIRVDKNNKQHHQQRKRDVAGQANEIANPKPRPEFSQVAERLRDRRLLLLLDMLLQQINGKALKPAISQVFDRTEIAVRLAAKPILNLTMVWRHPGQRRHVLGPVNPIFFDQRIRKKCDGVHISVAIDLVSIPKVTEHLLRRAERPIFWRLGPRRHLSNALSTERVSWILRAEPPPFFAPRSCHLGQPCCLPVARL